MRSIYLLILLALCAICYSCKQKGASDDDTYYYGQLYDSNNYKDFTISPNNSTIYSENGRARMFIKNDSYIIQITDGDTVYTDTLLTDYYGHYYDPIYSIHTRIKDNGQIIYLYIFSAYVQMFHYNFVTAYVIDSKNNMIPAPIFNDSESEIDGSWRVRDNQFMGKQSDSDYPKMGIFFDESNDCLFIPYKLKDEDLYTGRYTVYHFNDVSTR